MMRKCLKSITYIGIRVVLTVQKPADKSSPSEGKDALTNDTNKYAYSTQNEPIVCEETWTLPLEKMLRAFDGLVPTYNDDATSKSCGRDCTRVLYSHVARIHLEVGAPM